MKEDSGRNELKKDKKERENDREKRQEKADNTGRRRANHKLTFVIVLASLLDRFQSDLDARFRNSSGVPLLGDLFIAYIPFFKMYFDYLMWSEQAIASVRKWKTAGKYRRFISYIASCEALPAISPLKLEDLLDLPNKRM